MNQSKSNKDGALNFDFTIEDSENSSTLKDYYHQCLVDLLTFIKLHTDDAPITVDGFAYHDEPYDIISILDDISYNKESLK